MKSIFSNPAQLQQKVLDDARQRVKNVNYSDRLDSREQHVKTTGDV